MAQAKAPPLKAASIFALAAVVGALGGVFGFLFQSALRHFQIFRIAGVHTDDLTEAAALLSPWQRIAIPAFGGLLAALCLLLIKGRRSPFGITDVMNLVIKRESAIKIRDSLMQTLSSACSIASGSSIGRESANSQLGATTAAALGRWFRCSSRDRAVLLGCGVAAGMAVSYNAPIAGALFVMEVVLGNFAMDVFAPVVLSAVLAVLVMRQLEPDWNHALYAGPGGEASAIDMTDPTLVLSALLLGGICGVGAIGFRRTLSLGARAFAALRLPLIVSLPLGGALVGAIGILFPQVWGNGQEVVLGVISNRNEYGAIGLLIAITLLKAVATSISLGSGSLGGVFTPNLVVGAALGAVYAFGVQAVLPIETLGLQSEQQLRSGFALVGMAGLVAATAHAPITAVLIVFEFTRNYGLILPVMLCSIVGSVVARLLDQDSIFTAKLRAQGHVIQGGIEALAMQTNWVRDIMRTDVVSVLDTATFDEVMDVFGGARHDTIYVVDKSGALRGHIHIHDVKFFINDPSLTSVVIAADLTRPARAISPDQTLAQIFERFDDPDLEELPVVRGDILVGRLTRRDVIALLSDEVLGQRVLRAKLKAEDSDQATYVQLPAGTQLARVAVPDALVGRALDSLELTTRARLTTLVLVQHTPDGLEQRSLPEPGTVLPPGSALIVLGRPEDIQAFEKTAALPE
jgi:CIC family chloride channel protein